MRPPRPVKRFARAMPYAFEMPMPSEPVLVAMNGVLDVGVAGQSVKLPQPVDQIEVELLERDQQRVERRARRAPSTRSRRRDPGAPLLGVASSSVHSHVIRSIELKLDPMWPEPACMIM